MTTTAVMAMLVVPEDLDEDLAYNLTKYLFEQRQVIIDTHTRVNYAVEQARVKVDPQKRTILLEMKIDVDISSPMEYFEIFLNRMMMCRKAADFLDSKFELVMNGTKLL